MKLILIPVLLAVLAAAPCAFAQTRIVPFQILTGSGSFLGVGVAEIDQERARALNLKEERGVEITQVEADSPATKGGLKKGDVVQEYNGQRVEGIEQFIRLVRETPAGRAVKLLIVRNGTQQTVTATIAARKGLLRSGDEPFPLTLPPIRLSDTIDVPRVLVSWRTSTLGIEAEALESQLAQYFGVTEGVLVRSVSKQSAAEKAGLKAGDVIVKIDDTKTVTPREISSSLRAARGKKSFNLGIVREKKELTLALVIEDEQSENPSGKRVRVGQQ